MCGKVSDVKDFPANIGIVHVDQSGFRMPSDCETRAIGQLVIYPACFTVINFLLAVG